MEVIRSAARMQQQSRDWLVSGERVGLVPTMGALHAGHLALIQRAKQECARVLVSIYVNPLQFGPQEDLKKYPRPRTEDLARCRAAGVDLVFAPGQLYAPDHSTYVEEMEQARGREGAVRPGHFRGVATVVLKLFLLMRPTHAYFGQKDGQQVEVVRRMVRDLAVPVRIVTVPTVRSGEGLALSSRNRYLTPAQRIMGVRFARALQSAAQRKSGAIWLERELGKIPGMKIDYVEKVGNRLYAAVRVGSTRLLDNRKIS